MPRPLPKPDWMTEEEIEKIQANEWGWRKSVQNFICKLCKEPAYLHPLTDEIWGCKKCDFTTRKLPVFFVRVSKGEESTPKS